MLHTLNSVFAPAVMERLTLAINHVLGSEPAASARLAPHAGATIELVADNWPRLLPTLLPCVFRVTPAGLLEWCGSETLVGPAALTVRVDASNPALLMAKAFAGEQPAVAIDGDARLAGDVNWLMQNVRWDVAADLERLFGPVVADQFQRLGRALAGGLRAALQAFGKVHDRLRPRP